VVVTARSELHALTAPRFLKAIDDALGATSFALIVDRLRAGVPLLGGNGHTSEYKLIRLRDNTVRRRGRRPLPPVRRPSPMTGSDRNRAPLDTGR
jgi:hypothetical protein